MTGQDEPLYLGFDLSTQQLKAIVITAALNVTYSASVSFDAFFAEKYHVKSGVVTRQGPSGPPSCITKDERGGGGGGGGGERAKGVKHTSSRGNNDDDNDNDDNIVDVGDNPILAAATAAVRGGNLSDTVRQSNQAGREDEGNAVAETGEQEVVSPVLMWLEALDLVLAKLHNDGLDFARVRAVSGSCQQHGSVWWNGEAEARLQALNLDGVAAGAAGKQRLAELLRPALSSEFATNWQDHSTGAECALFDRLFAGGKEELAAVTGSCAHHRFTGPQIMRMRRVRPDVYAATAHISLVSSFLASVLLGRIAPVDLADVCGTNLWDIRAGQWSPDALRLVATGHGNVSVAETDTLVANLRRKLGNVAHDGGAALGPIAGYFVRRYGFAPGCHVIPCTGDNPATLLALPLRPRDAVVSLGTSTTMLMVTPRYVPDQAWHVFHHPTTKGLYMVMLCYKNGSLVREQVRDALRKVPHHQVAAIVGERKNNTPDTGGHIDNDGNGNGNGDGDGDDDDDEWREFNSAIRSTPLLGECDSRAKLGLYFPQPEIVPPIGIGTWRYTCDARTGGDLRRESQQRHQSEGKEQGQVWDVATDARIIIESQALSMRLRSARLVTEDSDAISQGNVTAQKDPTTINDMKQNAPPPQPRRIYLVGGGSRNSAIARVLGDVLGGTEGVYTLRRAGENACALGSAYKALWGEERQRQSGTTGDPEDTAEAGEKGGREGNAMLNKGQLSTVDGTREPFESFLAARWDPLSAMTCVSPGYATGTWEAYGRVLPAFQAMEMDVLAKTEC